MNEYFSTLFLIIRHLLVISVKRTKAMTDNILSKAKAIVHTLLITAAVFVIVPFILFILGAIFDEPWLFGLSGVLLALGTGLVLLAFSPLVALIQLLITKSHLSRSETARNLAKRYVNFVFSVMLVEMLMTFYCMFVPIMIRPELIVANIAALITLLALSNWWANRMSVILRGLSLVAAVTVLIVTTLTLLLPQTSGYLMEQFRSVDGYLPEQQKFEQQEKAKAEARARFIERLKKNGRWSDVSLDLSHFTSVNSLLTCEKGDTIDVKVEGRIRFIRWNGDPDSPQELVYSCGPEGGWPQQMRTEAYSGAIYPHHSRVFNALAWIVDLDNDPDWHAAKAADAIPIGAHRRFVAHKSGTLMLGINRPDPVIWAENISKWLVAKKQTFIFVKPAAACDSYGHGTFTYRCVVWKADRLNLP